MRDIAVVAVGNLIFTDTGELLLVKRGDLPADTFLLVDEDGCAIAFVGDFILVG